MQYFKKLLLNLIIITLDILLIVVSVKTFTHKLTPIIGTVSIVGILAIIYILITQVQNKYFRYKKPGMFKTTLVIILVVIIAAFAGFQPLASWKDNLINKIENIAKHNENQSNISAPIDTSTTPTYSNQSIASTSTTSLPITPTTIKPQLINPSWDELQHFLLNDKTDQLPYLYPVFVCEDFTNTLQANAKNAGWKCATLTVQLSGYPDFYNYGIPSDSGHALNAFETTDRGLVYIDDTGLPKGGYQPFSSDKQVTIKVGMDYVPQSIFYESGWNSTWDDMGKIVSIGNLNW